MKNLIPALLVVTSTLLTGACNDPCDDVLINVPTPTNGSIVFQNRCRQCHAPDGTGTEDGPDLNTRVPLVERCDIVRTVVDGQGEMEGFGDFLSLQEVADVTEYVFLEFR